MNQGETLAQIWHWSNERADLKDKRERTDTALSDLETQCRSLSVERVPVVDLRAVEPFVQSGESRELCRVISERVRTLVFLRGEIIAVERFSVSRRSAGVQQVRQMQDCLESIRKLYRIAFCILVVVGIGVLLVFGLLKE